MSSMCSTSAVGIGEFGIDTEHFDARIKTVLHEMGHALGMQHDNGRSCQCSHPSGYCIMTTMVPSGSTVYSRDPMFSSCSLADFQRFEQGSALGQDITHGNTECLSMLYGDYNIG